MNSEIPEGWVARSLDEVAAVNPRTPLAKGATAPYVGMADLSEDERTISEFNTREYKSGSKFKNQDVLVARITPCLENGKTAFVDILAGDEVGTGSTEFLVLRAKKEASEPLFLYYLARTPSFRDYAVGRMTGSSGRQRVSAGEIRDYQAAFPPVPEQRAIAEVLGSLDDRIAHLSDRMERLAAAGDEIFAALRARQTGTEPLGDWIKLDKGTSYSSDELVDGPEAGRPFINLGNFGRTRLPRWWKTKYYSGTVTARHEAPPGTVIVCATDMTSDRAVLGKALMVPGSLTRAVVSLDLFIVRQKDDSDYRRLATLLALNHEPYRRFLAEFANGTTVLRVPRDAVQRVPMPVVSPSDEQAFVNAVLPIWKGIDASRTEADTLSHTRDALLPELVNGRLRIADVDGFLERAGLS